MRRTYRWKALPKDVKQQIVALVVSGIVVVVLFDILLMFVDVYPWQIMLASYSDSVNTSNVAANGMQTFINHSLVVFIFLLILICGFFFSTVARALATRLHEWLKK